VSIVLVCALATLMDRCDYMCIHFQCALKILSPIKPMQILKYTIRDFNSGLLAELMGLHTRTFSASFSVDYFSVSFSIIQFCALPSYVTTRLSKTTVSCEHTEHLNRSSHPSESSVCVTGLVTILNITEKHFKVSPLLLSSHVSMV